MRNILQGIMIVFMAFFMGYCSYQKTGKLVDTPDAVNDNAVVLLENENTSLAVNLFGGAFTDFHLKTNPINPLSWGLTSEQMPENNQNGSPFRGHFLCLGRWGSPSEGEIKAGIPHNGEQSNTFWTLQDNKTPLHIDLFNEAPLDGLTVARTISLSKSTSVFKVKETFENVNPLGRINNVVQHPTLGPPFLSHETRLFTNATKGFLQKLSYPDPEKFYFEWPVIEIPEEQIHVDFSRSDHGFNGVATYIFDAEIATGWVAAYSPVHKLLMGYVWNAKEYPWLNIWHHEEAGKVQAKGIEFGTTGIGRPYKDLVMDDTRFFGKASYEYIDAGESITKQYYCFLIEMNSPEVLVENIQLDDNKLEIELNLGKKRDSVYLELPEM